MSLLAALGFVWLLPNSRNFIKKTGLGPVSPAGLGPASAPPGLPLLFLIAFGLMGVFVSIYNYAGFLLSASPYQLSQLQISRHIFYAYLLGTAASPIAGLADRLGRGPVLVAGTLLMAAGVVLTSVAAAGRHRARHRLADGRVFIAHWWPAAGWRDWPRSPRGHASSLYLWGYYMGSSVLGPGRLVLVALGLDGRGLRGLGCTGAGHRAGLARSVAGRDCGCESSFAS